MRAPEGGEVVLDHCFVEKVLGWSVRELRVSKGQVYSRLERLEMVEGTTAEIGLRYRWSSMRFVRAPMIGGMEPLSSLPKR